MMPRGERTFEPWLHSGGVCKKDGGKMPERERYQLRKAAGLYWLLDMEQDGKERKKPIVMNECGAFIWNQYLKMHTKEEIVKMLCQAYEVSEEEAGADVTAFMEEIKEQEIDLEI